MVSASHGYTDWVLVASLDCRVYRCRDQEGFQVQDCLCQVISTQVTAETAAWVIAEVVNIDNAFT